MNMECTVERILGLDIGVASVGWCLIETTNGTPSRLLAAGSRIYPPGVEGNVEAFSLGRDEPRNQKRRQARQMRRQLWRRRRRLLKLQRALVRHGLLPALERYDAEEIDRGFKALDAALMAGDPAMKDRVGSQTFHYRLRARAAAGFVSPHELGRALYHLAQHRGFLSNRKAQRTDDEELGKVKTGIAELEEAMRASGHGTLGAYFASLDPEATRIRGRWLGRNELIVPEFDAIRTEQSKHHSGIGAEAWDDIRDAIFRQRPLRDQSHLIGRCSIEEAERRCPVAYPEAQEFRILQAVNHLRLVELDEEGHAGAERPLSEPERATLVGRLMTESHLSFTAAKKALGLKPRSTRFTIERGGEKELIGNRTHARIAVEMGEAWAGMQPEDQRAMVDDMLEYESEDALERRLLRRWGLSRETARSLAATTLESARLSFSLKAIRRMLPHLRDGRSVQEAKIAAYPAHAGADAPWDLLPPLHPDRIWKKHCSGGRRYSGIEVRNPAVERSLSEVRKLVNGVIRRWGKPDEVRIELARDLKKPRGERMKESRRMREQGDRRSGALRRMVEEGFGHLADQNRRSDVEKVLLWEECGGVCPYTGRPIAFEDLFGPTPKFEVEHIIPFSLSLEDGFGNKTLCEIAENRSRKRRMSPFDAYHGTPQWEDIIGRVKRLRGLSAARKLKLFLSATNGSEVFGDFTERQLNDTRYASRLAGDYLGLLFGGRVDGESRRRVQVSAGGATAIVRRKLGIEGLLGGGEKNRKDHRHHAIDAIAIALTGPREVQQIARASEAAIVRGEASHRLKIEAPWPTFIDDARAIVDSMIVSHRVDRRLSGPMHLESNYSRPIRNIRGEVADFEARHARKRVDALGEKDVDTIVDPRVRDAVKKQLRALGQKDPKVAFKGGENLPTLRHGDGRDVSIRRVRVRVNKGLAVVGRGGAARHVAPGSNHHMAVVETVGPSGRVVGREFHVVTMLEAYRRRARREPIVQRDWGAGKRLAFTLRSGDAVDIEDGGGRCFASVMSVSANQIQLIRVEDARPTTEIAKAGKAGGRLALTPKQFSQRNPRKLMIGSLGDISAAND